MEHSFIAWDCSYRVFYFLIDALLAQNLGRDKWELFYVEQRTKRYANRRSKRRGLPSLWDRCQAVRRSANVQIIYLGDPASEPYHIGRCVNAGLEVAQGDIVSVMDGDQLLPTDFMHVLSWFHEEHPAGIACLARHMADRPVGASFENWTEASVDIDDVLSVCPYGRDPYPVRREPGNYGPMVSAKRKYWEAISGCDPHIFWSTSATCVLADAAKRLELETGVRAQVLMGTYGVHPWHPTGFARQGRMDEDERVLAHIRLQQAMIEKTTSPDWRERTPMVEEVYRKSRDIIDGNAATENKAMRANV